MFAENAETSAMKIMASMMVPTSGTSHVGRTVLSGSMTMRRTAEKASGPMSGPSHGSRAISRITEPT